MAFARRRSAYDSKPDSMVHICRLYGVRLTALRIEIASVFDDTDEPLDAQEIWKRLQSRSLSGKLTSIYRMLREMREAGAVTLANTRDRREFYQKRRTGRAVDLLDVTHQSLTPIVDDELVQRIERLAASHGYRLAGRIVVSVAALDAD